MDLKTSDYLLIFRGTDWHQGLSADELQSLMARWTTWCDGLRSRMHGANPLFPEGKVIAGKNRVVADGPFAESKEAIGGYILIHAASMDEAVELARSWPILDYGATVEVRPVAASCPIFAELPQPESVAAQA